MHLCGYARFQTRMAYRLTHRGAVQCNPAIRENILYSRLCARYDKSLWTGHIGDGQIDMQGAVVRDDDVPPVSTEPAELR